MRMLIWLAIFSSVLVGVNPAMDKEKYQVAWSIHEGWMPCNYAGHSGILKKWADKYDMEIELIQIKIRQN